MDSGDRADRLSAACPACSSPGARKPSPPVHCRKIPSRQSGWRATAQRRTPKNPARSITSLRSSTSSFQAEACLPLPLSASIRVLVGAQGNVDAHGESRGRSPSCTRGAPSSSAAGHGPRGRGPAPGPGRRVGRGELQLEVAVGSGGRRRSGHDPARHDSEVGKHVNRALEVRPIDRTARRRRFHH